VRARRAEATDERQLERNGKRIDSEGEAEDVDLEPVGGEFLIIDISSIHACVTFPLG
jgi:hypothetical protein